MQSDARTRWLCDNLRLRVASLVGDTCAINMDLSETSHGRTIVQITVAQEEVAKLIGEDGRLVKSLQQYVEYYAERHGGKYGVAVRGR